MKKVLPHGGFDSFADEILAEKSPRILTILCSSKVETLLLEILTHFLLPKRSKPKDQDELLEGDRPLATLSARIKASYRLGIIDETMFLELEKLRELRNKSAHEITFDISKSPMKDILADLRRRVHVRHSFQLTKERYFTGNLSNTTDDLRCTFLTLCVLLQAVCDKVRRTSSNKKTLIISSR